MLWRYAIHKGRTFIKVFKYFVESVDRDLSLFAADSVNNLQISPKGLILNPDNIFYRR